MHGLIKLVIINMPYLLLKAFHYAPQVASKNNKFTVTKLDGCFFLKLVSEMPVWKNSKKTLPQADKVTIQKVIIGFWTVAYNSKVN